MAKASVAVVVVCMFDKCNEGDLLAIRPPPEVDDGFPVDAMIVVPQEQAAQATHRAVYGCIARGAHIMAEVIGKPATKPKKGKGE